MRLLDLTIPMDVTMATSTESMYVKPMILSISKMMMINLCWFSATGTGQQRRGCQLAFQDSFLDSITSIILNLQARCTDLACLPFSHSPTLETRSIQPITAMAVVAESVQLFPGSAAVAPFHTTTQFGEVVLVGHSKSPCRYLVNTNLRSHSGTSTIKYHSIIA